MPNRRDVLKAAGLAVGGISLAACGDLTPPSSNTAIVPNGFRFYPVKRGGIAASAADLQFAGDAMIDDRNHIVYGWHSKTEQRFSVQALTISVKNNQVQIDSERTITAEGQKVNNHEILRLSGADLNFAGTLVLSAEADTGLRAALTDSEGNQVEGHGDVMPQQYLCLERGNGLEVLIKPFDKSAEGHQFIGMFGDTDIHDDGNIVFAADYQHLVENDEHEARHGVFQMRLGQVARLLLTNDSMVGSGSSAARIGRYGLIDLNDSGNLVVQAHTFSEQEEQSSPVLLQGNMNRINLQAPLSGLSLQTTNNLAVQSQGSSIRLGRMENGPRAGAKGRFAYVLKQGKKQSLVQNQKVITSTGASSPTGSEVLGALPPVMSANSLTYFVMGTKDGDELCAYDGQRIYSFLKSGDYLHNDNRPIDKIIFGLTTQQTNRAGAMAFVVSHADKSATLVLGLPV